MTFSGCFELKPSGMTGGWVDCSEDGGMVDIFDAIRLNRSRGSVR